MIRIGTLFSERTDLAILIDSYLSKRINTTGLSMLNVSIVTSSNIQFGRYVSLAAFSKRTSQAVGYYCVYIEYHRVQC